MAARLIGRPLHYVIKIGDRKKAIDFYIEKLGMKVLRHEEFEEGCMATCNGPYNGKWSKTMVGYGDEDEHFVVEMTYNYEVGGYTKGNDLQGLYVENSTAFERLATGHVKDAKPAKCTGKSIVEAMYGRLAMSDPDGNAVFLGEGDIPRVSCLSWNVTDVERSIAFWSGVLQMDIVSRDGAKGVVLRYPTDKPKDWTLQLRSLEGETLNRAAAYGRVAFACPTEKLSGVQSSVVSSGGKVLKPLVALDTPGKATVHVVILADPNGHEICFVGDEAFRELSKTDEAGERLLREAIEKDDSAEWFKEGKKKE